MTEPEQQNVFLDRCIAQLDEGVLLGNSIGTSSMYRWTNDAYDLLREIRAHRKSIRDAAMAEGEEAE